MQSFQIGVERFQMPNTCGAQYGCVQKYVEFTDHTGETKTKNCDFEQELIG